MWVRETGLVLCFFAVLVGVGPLGASGATGSPGASCGPANGKTLIAGRHARIYALPEPESGEDQIFACLVATGRSRNLQTTGATCPFNRCLGATVETAPLAIHAPWIAYPKTFGGRDTSVLAIAAKNLLTGDTKLWVVGSRNGPPRNAPSVTDLALKRNGSVAWVAIQRVKPPLQPVYIPPGTTPPPVMPPPRWWYERRVAAADRTGQHLLDSGEGIDLHSLKLHGSTLSWIDFDETRTAQLG